MFPLKKKQSELSVLKNFIQHYEEFPRGKLRKTESPDFIVEINPRQLVGIELTRLLPVASEDSRHRYIPSRVDKEILDLTISKKDEKLPIYREKKLDYIWLIITVDRSDSPADTNLPNRLREWEFTSMFHKIFLFETGKGQVHILK